LRNEEEGEYVVKDETKGRGGEFGRRQHQQQSYEEQLDAIEQKIFTQLISSSEGGGGGGGVNSARGGGNGYRPSATSPLASARSQHSFISRSETTETLPPRAESPCHDSSSFTTTLPPPVTAPAPDLSHLLDEATLQLIEQTVQMELEPLQEEFLMVLQDTTELLQKIERYETTPYPTQPRPFSRQNTVEEEDQPMSPVRKYGGGLGEIKGPMLSRSVDFRTQSNSMKGPSILSKSTEL
jgi:hypothetical protein